MNSEVYDALIELFPELKDLKIRILNLYMESGKIPELTITHMVTEENKIRKFDKKFKITEVL